MTASCGNSVSASACAWVHCEHITRPEAIQDVDEAGAVCGGTGFLVAVDPLVVDAASFAPSLFTR